MSHFVDANYNTVSYGQLVQAIRRDLESLKNADFIVKKHLFPGGMSITITLMRKIDSDMPIWNENADEGTKNSIKSFKNFIERYGSMNFQYQPFYYPYFSNEINELMKQAKDIALAYNRKNSDPMTANFNIYMEIELKK
jgi:hypothetical protein